MTQAELVARHPSPIPTNKEPVGESSKINQLGESYVGDVQHNFKHIPFHCTDAEAHEHFTNHFNECLRDKEYNMFKDLFSNINLDIILETIPKITIYNKIIVQFVEETNLKYGLDLKCTNLEAPEVDLWAKTFQAMGHSEDQQMPRQLALPQYLEPPQQQPHQHTQAHQTASSKVVATALLTDIPLLMEQWVETD